MIDSIEDYRKLTQPFEKVPQPNRVLMVSPKYFAIEEAINVHMLREDGTAHVLDKERAEEQWVALKQVYTSLGYEVFVVEGQPSLPDMVFCANQSFPYLNENNQPCAILSNMRQDTRHKEVPFIQAFLESQNYLTAQLGSREQGLFFESMGDALWVPGTRFVLGGYGFRTHQKVYESISQRIQAPIARFALENPKFYHLDTCLSIVNATTALACPNAFSLAGWSLLKAIFPTLIEVDVSEADSPLFACNAHCPDGKHVILQKGSQRLCDTLCQVGLIPIEVDTSEFIKSGGSVFCLKLMFF